LKRSDQMFRDSRTLGVVVTEGVYHFQVMGCNWIGGCRRRVLVDQHSYRSYLGDLSLSGVSSCLVKEGELVSSKLLFWLLVGFLVFWSD